MISFLAAALLHSAGSALAADRPNIVFMDICSARADHFGTYGYKVDTTPRIDAFAKQGVLFENAVAQGSWCLPNFASLFTGQVTEVHGHYTSSLNKGLPEGSPTLPEALKTAGYATAAFSGGVYLMQEFGLSRGFDVYSNAVVPGVTKNGHVSAEGNLPKAFEWIEGRKGKPFFLYLAIDDLHSPYIADDPERFDPGYEGIVHDTHTLTAHFYRAYNGEKSGFALNLLPMVDVFRRDPRNLVHLRAHYDAALKRVDREVGEVLDRLQGAGLDGNTIVIVTADHGEMLGEKNLLGHQQSLYEGVVHVPLIVRDPDYKGLAGKRLQQAIQRVDLMPTLLEMARVSPQGMELQGRSILELLGNPSVRWRDYAYSSSKRDQSDPEDLRIEERSLRGRRWKLHFYLYKKAYELYDLTVDPLEEHDVSLEHPDIVAQLAFELMKEAETKRPHAPGPPSGKDRTGFTLVPRQPRD